jgi:hypothetical protein
MTDTTALSKDEMFVVIAAGDMPALAHIFHPWEIRAGDHIFIDPNEVPKIGDMVLIDDNLVEWKGETLIRGVAFQVGRNVG